MYYFLKFVISNFYMTILGKIGQQQNYYLQLYEQGLRFFTGF